MCYIENDLKKYKSYLSPGKDQHSKHGEQAEMQSNQQDHTGKAHKHWVTLYLCMYYLLLNNEGKKSTGH